MSAANVFFRITGKQGKIEGKVFLQQCFLFCGGLNFVVSINKETEGLKRATIAIIKAIVAVRLFGEFSGLPRCKNLTRISLFVSFCFAVRHYLKCFVSFVLRHP